MTLKKQLTLWLVSLLFLIVTIIAVGGVTRLTDSGLSMVDWRPVYGILPPTNTTQWTDVFENYQSFPQYQQTHNNLTLEGFKKIFFWEYLHRILGRIIGLWILIPFLFFLYKKKLSSHLKTQGAWISVLVVFQGLAGWFMVKSGLSDVARVSHFRLTLHLSLAFFLFVVILWTLLNIHGKRERSAHGKLFKTFFIVLIIQIIYGAFTAGLDAGFTFNTFPKMGRYWFPEEISMMNTILENLLFNPICVQFIHRLLGMSLFLLSFLLVLKQKQFKPLLFLTTGQFVLGVLTLVMHVPVVLAVLHQLGALGLLSSVVYFLYNSTESRCFE
jgi:heme a synthase